MWEVGGGEGRGIRERGCSWPDPTGNDRPSTPLSADPPPPTDRPCPLSTRYNTIAFAFAISYLYKSLLELGKYAHRKVLNMLVKIPIKI